MTPLAPLAHAMLTELIARRREAELEWLAKAHEAVEQGDGASADRCTRMAAEARASREEYEAQLHGAPCP